MAEETNGDAWERVKRHQSDLARTAYPKERAAIRSRLREARRGVREERGVLRAAAVAGDRDAREPLDGLGYEPPEW